MLFGIFRFNILFGCDTVDLTEPQIDKLIDFIPTSQENRMMTFLKQMIDLF